MVIGTRSEKYKDVEFSSQLNYFNFLVGIFVVSLKVIIFIK